MTVDHCAGSSGCCVPMTAVRDSFCLMLPHPKARCLATAGQLAAALTLLFKHWLNFPHVRCLSHTGPLTLVQSLSKVSKNQGSGLLPRGPSLRF